MDLYLGGLFGAQKVIRLTSEFGQMATGKLCNNTVLTFFESGKG